jgi:uncharacterized membrane protein
MLMALFLIGLVLFIGTHSVRIFAEDWRVATRMRLGEKMYKGIYSLASIVGFVLLVYGFSQIRWDSPMLWSPPTAMRHIAVLLMLISLVLLVATYVPNNAFKARLHHPMVLSVKVWALAHVLANGRLADLILFGAFLVWAVLDFRAARQRDRLMAEAVQDLPAEDAPVFANNGRVVAIGVVVWLALLLGGHTWLFGVSPIGL